MPSPDRTRIALSSNRGGSYDLWVMDADGHNLRRLTTDAGTEGEPVWTHDGTRIVYTTSPRAGPPQLASIRVDGTDNRALTTAGGGNHSADISPDGSTVVFVSTRDGNPEDLRHGARRQRTAADGKGIRRESYPRYLPNGDLVFAVEKGGGSRVQLLAAGATQPVNCSRPASRS